MARTRVLYQTKMTEFKERWRRIEVGQKEVKQNLVKFNNFVKEKQGKVEGGLEKARLEVRAQEEKSVEFGELEKEKLLYEEAKAAIEKAVEGKKVFSNYLQAVVDVSQDTYPDIQKLMERCQALVATRNKLRDRVAEIHKLREHGQFGFLGATARRKIVLFWYTDF